MPLRLIYFETGTASEAEAAAAHELRFYDGEVMLCNAQHAGRPHPSATEVHTDSAAVAQAYADSEAEVKPLTEAGAAAWAEAEAAAAAEAKKPAAKKATRKKAPAKKTT